MRPRIPLALLGGALVAAAFLTPPADAHGTCGGATAVEEQVTIGPYVGYVQIGPAPLIEGAKPQMAIQLFNGTTYEPKPGLSVSHVVRSPDGTNASTGVVAERSPALYGGELQLGDAGTQTLLLEVSEPNATSAHGIELEFEAYPDLPFRMQPANVDADPVQGRATELRYYAVDPSTDERIQGMEDLTVRFDLVSADGKSRTSEGEVEAEYRDGVWVLEHTFSEVGVYEVRFASESSGFTYGDLPPDKVCTLEGTDPGAAGDAAAQTPAAPAAFAVLAALGVALARRR